MDSLQQIKIDVAVLQEKIGKIEETISMYETNHFPTIERRFDSIERKIAYWSGGIAIALGFLQIILKFF